MLFYSKICFKEPEKRIQDSDFTSSLFWCESKSFFNPKRLKRDTRVSFTSQFGPWGLSPECSERSSCAYKWRLNNIFTHSCSHFHGLHTREKKTQQKNFLFWKKCLQPSSQKTQKQLKNQVLKIILLLDIQNNY